MALTLTMEAGVWERLLMEHARSFFDDPAVTVASMLPEKLGVGNVEWLEDTTTIPRSDAV